MRVPDLKAAATRWRARWAALDLKPRLLISGAGLGLLVGIFTYLGGGSAPALPGMGDAAVPVVVGTVERKQIPIYLDGLGTVQASNTVQLRSRVDGQIVEIRFREGQDVQAGDVLALIDPRPFEANLKQMQANLLRDQAQLADARVNLARLIALKDYATRRSVDTQRAEVAQFEALIAADQAQVDYARAQLDYTVIRSPIGGRTGLRQVDIGNVVHAADPNPIVTVTQLKPIAVLFTLNADHLPAITKGLDGGSTLGVTAFAKDNRTVLAEGKLDLVDNQIDQATGTVKLKASFPNADLALWPGQFVNARLQVRVHDGLVVAATAIQQGPNGAYVWVIGPDSTVQMRSVVVGQVQDGQALIASGLAAGQKVVIDGQYKLQPGSATAPAAVRPEDAAPPTPADPAA